LYWQRVGLEEVEIVVEPSRVDRWEDVVDTLDQSEAKSVVESPARVGEEI